MLEGFNDAASSYEITMLDDFMDKSNILKYKNLTFTYLFRSETSPGGIIYKGIRKFFCRKSKSKILVTVGLVMLRLIFWKRLSKIARTNFQSIHSSFCDFDESNLLTCLIYPFLINKEFHKSYKETRLAYNHLEYLNLKYCQSLSVFCQENLDFLKWKYPSINLSDKKIYLGLDEDARYYSNTHKIIGSLNVSKKSDNDNKLHVAILAGRVFSEGDDSRSGARLYYIPFIKSMIELGNVVHLHTLKIYDDRFGNNKYEELATKYPNQFFIEKPLDLDNAKEFYETLAQYDCGMLHMYIDGTEVSKFDQYNIPNRFYHYQIANVVPLQEKGTKPVLEKYYPKSCFFYSTYKDINFQITQKKFDFVRPTFAEYFSEIHGD